jgi:hypothetical protein
VTAATNADEAADDKEWVGCYLLWLAVSGFSTERSQQKIDAYLTGFVLKLSHPSQKTLKEYIEVRTSRTATSVRMNGCCDQRPCPSPILLGVFFF